MSSHLESEKSSILFKFLSVGINMWREHQKLPILSFFVMRILMDSCLFGDKCVPIETKSLVVFFDWKIYTTQDK